MSYQAAAAANLEVYLARLVVSHGGEDKGAFTTGPLVPLEPGDEPAQVHWWIYGRFSLTSPNRMFDFPCPPAFFSSLGYGKSNPLRVVFVCLDESAAVLRAEGFSCSPSFPLKAFFF